MAFSLKAGEILLIIFAGLLFAPHYRNFAPETYIRGQELSYLLNSGATAAYVFQKTGKIPLWNPFMGVGGEPLIENPFSFVLNPLMSGPILLFGPIQGSKVAVLLHILMMGVGGWLLGHMLRLSWAGRLLLGLLLMGNGSFASPIGQGFYQMSLSQAYVPWVLTGLLGTLYRKSRWPIALLAISAALMVFAGTFWYVLPLAMSSALVVVWGAFRLKPSKRPLPNLTINWQMLGRVALAMLFTLGLTAIRVLPQAVHTDFIYHPENRESFTSGFLQLISLYFTSGEPLFPEFADDVMYYHYILPIALALVVLLMRLILALWHEPRIVERRLIVPAFISIVFYTAWAQGNTPFVQFLYQVVPLLKEWRFVGRILAAATPWLAIIAAIWFDEIVVYLWRWARRDTSPRIPAGAHKALRLVALSTAALLVSGGGLAAQHVLQNWGRVTGMESAWIIETEPIRYLRRENRTNFLMVRTENFWNYLPFYETLTRAVFGNPDYAPRGLASTIGTPEVTRFMPEYRLGFHEFFARNVTEQGYVPVWGAPSLSNGTAVLYHNPDAPPYAFVASPALLDTKQEPIRRSDTLGVNFFHRIDSVVVEAIAYPPGSILVVQEIAYPGWQVTINGQEAKLESVGNRLGVRLLDDPPLDSPTVIEFSYQPRWLYLGGIITLLAALAAAGYVLNVDKLNPSEIRALLAEQPAQPVAIQRPLQAQAPQASPLAESRMQAALNRQSEQIAALAAQVSRLEERLAALEDGMKEGSMKPGPHERME